MIKSNALLCGAALVIWGCATACTTVNGPSPQRLGARSVEVQSTSSPRFDPAKYEKLALIMQDLTDTRSPDAALARQIEDVMAQALFSKGYRLAARSDIKSLMKEITLQTSGLTDADAARVGRLLNVPAC